ncbi:MAG: NAD(P)/FAD-dependent oxidoreductase [Terriglobia bacterium]
MSARYDIIIIGAGPAGSTAAKLAADAGYQTLLVDKAQFPRHKTCASWINRLVFERFPYLEPHREQLVDSAFWGLAFLSPGLEREARWAERKPSGYLSLRSKFDNGLKDIAVASGAEFRPGVRIEAVRAGDDGVAVRLENGDEFEARVLLGADGANSRVAALAGLRRGWAENEYVLCANEDLAYPPERIERFYSVRPPLFVALQFAGLTGYGWVFPKRAHICVGIGGRLRPSESIRALYHNFFRAAQQRRYLPEGVSPQKVYYAPDPAGAVSKGRPIVQGRVVLVGDAAGFVSGSTGEGIYPAMESARMAVELADRGLRAGNVEAHLAKFQTGWREQLGSYLRDLPGGVERQQTVDRIGWIFRSRLVCGVAARVFLYGEPVAWRTLWRAVWS